MNIDETAVGSFEEHASAEDAVKKLAQAGFDMRSLSIVGKAYHTEEKVIGFYNQNDRVQFWGSRGAYWGALWGLFFGGVFVTIPIVGSVIVLGYLATAAISAVEGAAVVGGLSALGAALYGVGIPKDSVVQYETAIKADGYLVLAHGSASDIARAKAILTSVGASSVESHHTARQPEPLAIAL